MSFPPGQVGSPLPIQLSAQGGVASAPLYLRMLRKEALLPSFSWAVPLLPRDGNGMTFWEVTFFRLPPSDTFRRGDSPVVSRWVTAEALRKVMRYASRDYSLRAVATNWFLGASSTFGRPVQRARPLCDSVANIGGVVGWGSFPVLSRWTTWPSLATDLHWVEGGTTLRNKMLDWFFGRTTGSTDLHILYTRTWYT